MGAPRPTWFEALHMAQLRTAQASRYRAGLRQPSVGHSTNTEGALPWCLALVELTPWD